MSQITKGAPDIMQCTTNSTGYTSYAVELIRLSPPRPIKETLDLAGAAKLTPPSSVLLEMSKKSTPPQEWWDEDFTGL